MWWNLNLLHLQNFGTHIDTELPIQQDVCSMIVGINKTEPGANSNGAGKSHIYEAITKLYTNRTFKKVGKADLIMDGQKQAIIEGHHTASNGDTLVIKRTIKRSGSDTCEIIFNGKSKDEIVDKDKWILEMMGITYDDVINYYIVAQNNNFSIFESGDTYIKSLISGFVKADFLDQAFSECKNKIEELQDEIDELETNIVSLESKMELLAQQTTDIEQNAHQQILDDVEAVETEIKQLKRQRKTIKQVDLIEVGSRIENTTEKLTKLNSKKIDVTRLQKERSDLIAWRKDCKAKIGELEDENEKLQRQWKHKLTCPKCKANFTASNVILDHNKIQKQIDQNNNNISAGEKNLEQYNKEILACDEQIDVANEVVQKIKSAEHTLKLLDKEKLGLQNDIKKIGVVIAEKEENLITLLETLEQVDNGNFAVIPQWKKNKTSIKDFKIKVVKIKKERDVLVAEKAKYEFWKISFGKKGFKTFLLNKAVNTIEGYVNHYLQKFKTNLLVKMQGFKENKDGSISDRITTRILRNGIDAGVYAKFSGGERRRIDICGILAVRQIKSASMSSNQGLNLLALDEVFEGLDAYGQREISNMLISLGNTVLITTHTAEHVKLPNTYTLVKTSGITRLQK